MTTPRAPQRATTRVYQPPAARRLTIMKLSRVSFGERTLYFTARVACAPYFSIAPILPVARTWSLVAEIWITETIAT
jgi:hypothetical protein